MMSAVAWPISSSLYDRSNVKWRVRPVRLEVSAKCPTVVNSSFNDAEDSPHCTTEIS